MREISLDNWIKEGSGFSADSYRHRDNPNLLLKLFFTANGMELAEKEFRRARDVAALGVPTPAVYELVTADAKAGITFERIEQKKSFGRLVSDNPEKLPEYARIFAENSRALHSVKCDTDKFPDQKEVMRGLLLKADIREEIREYLSELLDGTEEADTCLHGDLQTGNMVMGKGDKVYFIDLGYFAYGNPVFDIAAIYMCTQVYQNEEVNKEMLHMTTEQLEDFWKYYAAGYIRSENPEELKAFENYVAPYAMFYMILIIEAAAGYEPAIKIALTHIEELYERMRN